MKRSSISGLAILVVLVLLVGFTACARDRGAIKESSNPNAYYTEQLSPGVIRVVAVTQNTIGSAEGYGRALSMAIKEISQTYDIVDTTSINYASGSNSVTMELIIIVKPK